MNIVALSIVFKAWRLKFLRFSRQGAFGVAGPR